ncbi:hypothetical protein FRC08_013747, partial [Ceratobasidium sp. 394]
MERASGKSGAHTFVSGYVCADGARGSQIYMLADSSWGLGACWGLSVQGRSWVIILGLAQSLATSRSAPPRSSASRSSAPRRKTPRLAVSRRKKRRQSCALPRPRNSPRLPVSSALRFPPFQTQN